MGSWWWNLVLVLRIDLKKMREDFDAYKETTDATINDMKARHLELEARVTALEHAQPPDLRAVIFTAGTPVDE